MVMVLVQPVIYMLTNSRIWIAFWVFRWKKALEVFKEGNVKSSKDLINQIMRYNKDRKEGWSFEGNKTNIGLINCMLVF